MLSCRKHGTSKPAPGRVPTSPAYVLEVRGESVISGASEFAPTRLHRSTSGLAWRSPDPDAALGGKVKLVPLLDAERFVELGHVADHAVAAKLAR